MYEINPSNYQDILRDKITKNYKIDHEDSLKFAYKLHIEYRLGKFKMKEAYILFKDRKPNFENKLQCRLIKTFKTESGIISKNIIQNIIIKIEKTTHINLWMNSNDTIEWFRNIKNKSKITFIQFDIIDFYPSITKKF